MTFKICLTLLLFNVINIISGCDPTQSNLCDNPIVEIRQGKLKGERIPLLDGKNHYYSFKGIPYAKIPARFMDPLPPTPWRGIHDATQHGDNCTQYDPDLGNYVGSENCLFINVYTTSLDPTAKLPVMVFIHGGSLMTGSGNSYNGFGPEHLVRHDVIQVTLNYRLEVLGFLSLHTREVPGNAGMKDQVAALRWVKRNIAQFGGDPNAVTLYGESSGSSSVTYHMQSSMSRGLFRSAIAQSGVSLAEWAQGTDSINRAFRAAKYLGLDSKNTTEVLEFLRSVPATKLVNLTYNTMTVDEQRRGLAIHFLPVTEKKFKGVERFLTETTIDALVAGKMNRVPLMIGYNSNEALIMLDDAFGKLNTTNESPRYLVPREVAQKISEDKEKELGQSIKNFYAGQDKDFTTNEAQKIANMLSDLHFIYNIHRFSHFYAPLSETYMEKFSCDTELNVIKILTGHSDMPGASHADDLFYIFYNIFNKDIYANNPKLHDVVYRITKLLTNFAKSGKPTPDNALGVRWTPYTNSNQAYLDINEKLTLRNNAEKERVEFWDKIYCDAGLPCIGKSFVKC